MTILGSNLESSSPGGPLPTYREKEETATAMNARAALGIVRDTMENPTLMLAVNKDLLKYESSAPRLGLPILSATRVSGEDNPALDDSWREVYKELPQLMPKEFRELFLSSMSLNESSRNRNITIADSSLHVAAKLVSLLRQASGPVDPESLVAIRAQDNLVMPFIGLNALTSLSNELSSETEVYLSLVGANNPNFDKIANFLGEFTLIRENLNAATVLLTNDNTVNDAKDLVRTTNGLVTALAKQFDRLGAGGELLLLSNTLHALELSTASLLLENQGAAAILLGLANATYGIDDNKSALALEGSAYAAVTNAIADGIKSAYLNGTDPAKELMFNSLLNNVFLSTFSLGTLLYDSKAIKRDKDTSPEAIAERNLLHDLNLSLVSGSGLLSAVGKLLAKESGASTAQQGPMSSMIEANLILMLISPSLKGNDLTSAEPLLKGLSGPFGNALARGTEGLESLNIASQSLKVYLQQASIALDRGDMDALLGALENSLEMTGASSSELVKDINQLKKSTHTVATNVDVSSSNNAATGINLAA